MNTHKLIVLTRLLVSLIALSNTTFYAMEQQDNKLQKNTIFRTLINNTDDQIVAFIPIQYPRKVITYRHRANKNSSIILGISNLVQKKHFDTTPSTNVLIIKTKNHEYILTHGDYRGPGTTGYPYTTKLWCFEKKQAQTLSPESNTFPSIEKTLSKSEEALTINNNLSLLAPITHSLNELSLSNHSPQRTFSEGPYLIDLIITDGSLSAVFEEIKTDKNNK